MPIKIIQKNKRTQLIFIPLVSFISFLACSLSSFAIMTSVSAAVLTHDKEIGLYQNNQHTQFIRNTDILSPKSVDFVGDKLFINALEREATIVYDTNTWTVAKTIHYQFPKPDFLTVKDFPYTLETKSFSGKPVEFTHYKNTAWVPFYRLSWDTNSRYHSAMAQIDLTDYSIKKLIPAGSIPKMIRVSSDGKFLVNTHWGDNTVGIYDLNENQDIIGYHYYTIDQKLNTSSISGDRDKNCGLCLRGTVITPDNKYIIIGRMRGGGLAVINLHTKKYIGTIYNVPLTPRHLLISNDNQLVLSTCFSGEISKISLASLYKHFEELENKQKVSLQKQEWTTLKLGSSVRTIDLSKDSQYIYAALNDSSELAVIDYNTMKVVEKFKIAQYPVGLAVSNDDKYVAVTSQGKEGHGGNHVDIFLRNHD